MIEKASSKILCIINPLAGNTTADWPILITDFFETANYNIEFFYLPQHCGEKMLINTIMQFAPTFVIAVGGDGTIKLVAACLIQKNIPLGILPAGSANGFAKELGISDVPAKALAIIKKGFSKKIHVININNVICIHLSDIGINANAMKRFETQHCRGMWGYLKASLYVLLTNPVMEVEMLIDNKAIKMKAAVIVIANATTYG